MVESKTQGVDRTARVAGSKPPDLGRVIRAASKVAPAARAVMGAAKSLPARGTREHNELWQRYDMLAREVDRLEREIEKAVGKP